MIRVKVIIHDYRNPPNAYGSTYNHRYPYTPYDPYYYPSSHKNPHIILLLLLFIINLILQSYLSNDKVSSHKNPHIITTTATIHY